MLDNAWHRIDKFQGEVLSLSSELSYVQTIFNPLLDNDKPDITEKEEQQPDNSEISEENNLPEGEVI